LGDSPLRYPASTVLFPALKAIQQRLGAASIAAAAQAVPALRALVQQAVENLRAVAAKQAPAPPADWARHDAAARLHCGARACRDCPTLRAFLVNGGQQQLRLSLAKARVKHLAA